MRRWFLILAILVGCAGGGSSVPSDNAEILHWVQPALYDDNTPMDVRRDVSRWDVYCTFFPFPADNDLVASVANSDNLSFNLSLLRAHGIEPGPDGKFVFLRCVSIDNTVSKFSEPTEWR